MWLWIVNGLRGLVAMMTAHLATGDIPPQSAIDELRRRIADLNIVLGRCEALRREGTTQECADDS